MPKFLKSAARRVNEELAACLLARRFGKGQLNRAALRHVALFPMLNLAYNRIKKNANSSTMAVLYRLENGRLGEGRESKLGMPTLSRLPPNLLFRLDQFQYLVLVRNPYSRVLSAFLNKFAKAAYVERFNNFSTDPEGFANFVRWLGEGHLDADPHWDLQSKMLLGPLGGFDQVLRFEDFPGNLVAVLSARGAELPHDLDTILASVNQATRTNALQLLDQFYRTETAKLVRKIFEADFSILPYGEDLKGAMRS